jgi:hypothetical protein
MTKFISINDNGVVYVENECAEIFGIVSSLQVTDEHGIQFDSDAFTVLEKYGFDLEQDWEKEHTYFVCQKSNGDNLKVVFKNESSVFIEEINEAA